MQELLDFKIHQEVSTSYFKFGVILLNDETGSRVSGFEHACLRDPEPIVKRILQEWLEGKGLSVTWEILIKTLRDIELSTLADQIAATKK